MAVPGLLKGLELAQQQFGKYVYLSVVDIVVLLEFWEGTEAVVGGVAQW